MVRVLFFASLREDVGVAQLELTQAPATVDALFAELESQLSESALLALRSDNVRIAVDQVLVEGNASLEGASELAFLPPVTGG